MLKKVTTIAVTLLVALTLTGQREAFASSKAERQARATEKVKSGILKLGVGEQARVTVKMNNKTKVAGYISEIQNDHFVVKDANSSSTTTIAYASVAQVKGNNLSTGAKIAIWVGVAVAVAIILYSVRGAFCDGQC
ncbi:MAG TPA: hypothetical protein VF131_17205 [Blastocatellia bacterium]|nr:hypothetical protein [Blastocatellia bacterium]